MYSLIVFLQLFDKAVWTFIQLSKSAEGQSWKRSKLLVTLEESLNVWLQPTQVN